MKRISSKEFCSRDQLCKRLGAGRTWKENQWRMLLTVLRFVRSTIEVSISTWKITLAWDDSKYENLNLGNKIVIYNKYIIIYIYVHIYINVYFDVHTGRVCCQCFHLKRPDFFWGFLGVQRWRAALPLTASGAECKLIIKRSLVKIYGRFWDTIRYFWAVYVSL